MAQDARGHCRRHACVPRVVRPSRKAVSPSWSAAASTSTTPSLDERIAALTSDRLRHDRLHVGHDGTAQGLRDHPRQPARQRAAEPRRGALDARTRRGRPHVLAAGPHVVEDHRPRRGRVGHQAGVRHRRRASPGGAGCWYGRRWWSRSHGCSRRCSTARSRRPMPKDTAASSTRPTEVAIRWSKNDAPGGHHPITSLEHAAFEPAGVPQAASSVRRAHALRRQRRRPPRRAAHALLQRRRGQDLRGLRADRDQPDPHGQPCRRMEARHGRNAARGHVDPHRGRRRDLGEGSAGVSGVLAQRAGHRRRRSTTTDGS